MDDVKLPPELEDDPLSRLARREASDQKLVAVNKQIQANEENLKRWSERAESREKAAKRLETRSVIVLFGCIIVCALLFLLSVAYGSRLRSDAYLDRSYAANERERQRNAALDARRHTFGAHFDPVAKGWFMDFPYGTVIRITTFHGSPAIQVLPNGR